MRSVCVILLFFLSLCSAQYRYGTTAANFLEIGTTSNAVAMGEAYVSMADDAISAYWNPAGLASVRGLELGVSSQDWVVGIKHSTFAAAVYLGNYGTISALFTDFDYGSIEVTNIGNQEGTGEHYSANEISASLSYGRNLVEWFSFGASLKIVGASIWHSSARATAFDLGVIVKTHFFSKTKERKDGMKIGMSISNYGTRLRYDGMDLLVPIDPNPDEYGNFDDVEGLYNTSEWELPLIFRLGFSIQPIYTNNLRLLVAADALHPNNNNESINIGTQLTYIQPGKLNLFLRGGYKGLFLKDSEYGLTYGGGLRIYLSDFNFFDLDYTYKTMGILGDVHLYTFKFSF